MTSNNNFIKFMLDVKDKNILFSDDYFYKFIKGKKAKVFNAELIQPACPHCGSVDIKHNGHYISNIRYITANASQPVIIRLSKQRVLCNDCGERSMAKSDLINKYCCISNISKRKIISALTEDRSMTSIAREHNVSVNTVQRVLASCSHNFHSDWDSLPKHLAFDEFRGVGRKLHFICIDGEKHKVIKIIQNRFKKSILKYFGKYSPQARESVETVTMDLNCYYPDAVRACFPNAKVVIDRFHMIQMLNRSFNSLRVSVMRQLDRTSRQYKLLKGYWKLYLMRYDKLEKTKPKYQWRIKDSLTQEQIVNEGLDVDDNGVLRNTYEAMQNFSQAMQKHDVQAIKEIIYSKNIVGKQMHTTLLTFKRNYRGVINGIDLEYSNGCLEGLNRKIKQIERTAFGCRNFVNLLKRIHLEEN
ncbi:ISL3 family transposase, partial [Lactobacillus corticis]